MIERAEELEKALKKSGGRAVVLVHPFYHKYRPEHYDEEYEPVNPKRNLTGKEYLEKQELLIRRTQLPLIILEEASNVERTRKALKRDAFFIPTRPKNPDPVKGWAVIDELRRKGLKVAVMGGQKLICADEKTMTAFPHRVRIHEVNLFKKKLPGVPRYETFPYDGCVSSAVYQFMRRKVRVGLMRNVVYPDKPQMRK